MSEHIIQAAILNHEGNQVIVHAETGELPELQYEQAHGTVEGTLHVLGRQSLVGAHVSVDYRHNNEGKLLYQTKPVPVDAQPIDPYQWGDVPGSITIE